MFLEKEKFALITNLDAIDYSIGRPELVGRLVSLSIDRDRDATAIDNFDWITRRWLHDLRVSSLIAPSTSTQSCALRSAVRQRWSRPPSTT